MTHHCVILGIHGLANKPPPDVLDQGWSKAILEGLQRNEGRGPGNVPFELVYWADWGHAQPLDATANAEPYREAPGEGPLPSHADGFLDSLRAEAGDLLDTPLDWVKRTFGIGEAVDSLLGVKLKDLARYYQEPDRRALLRDRLEARLLAHRGKRIMLVAHSMGSIVAYDVLRALGKREPDLRIDHLVTLGSPLGLPHVKFHISEEHDQVRTPTVVHRWTNLADRRDPVAVDNHLADDYAPNPRGVEARDDLVLNGYRDPQDKPNPHKSYGYLRTPEFSKLLRGFL